MSFRRKESRRSDMLAGSDFRWLLDRLGPMPNQLHGALNAIFEAAEGIVFKFGGAHSFSKAARADSFTASADCASSARLRKAASSCNATSARTLRFRSIPAALRPCTNLL